MAQRSLPDETGVEPAFRDDVLSGAVFGIEQIHCRNDVRACDPKARVRKHVSWTDPWGHSVL